MKRTLLLTLLAVLLLAVPLSAQALPSVQATLACDDVWIRTGEPAALKIDVTNLGTEPVTVTGYTVGGLSEAENVLIAPGTSHRFYAKSTVDFANASETSIIASVSLGSGPAVLSNAMTLYKQADAPCVFSVEPASTVVSSGDTVEYALAFENTSGLDYSAVTITLDGTKIVPAFSCPAGQKRTFTHSKTYTQPAEHRFSYTLDYPGANGRDVHVTGDIQRVLVSLRVPQPAGTPMDGLTLAPGFLTAMADTHNGIQLNLYLKNNSDSSLTGVHVYDAVGTDYGGWSTVGIGQTASITLDLHPVEETTYTFAAFGKDSKGQMRLAQAEPVLIAVGSLPADLGQTGMAGAPTPTPTRATLGAAASNKKSYIMLGIVVGLIVVVLVTIIIIASGRKRPKRKRNTV